jgi:hypothetical protein
LIVYGAALWHLAGKEDAVILGGSESAVSERNETFLV